MKEGILMENLEKDIKFLKSLKFRSNAFLIFNLYNAIIALVPEIMNYGTKDIVTYVFFPMFIILSYLWNMIYFVFCSLTLKKYIEFKPYWYGQYSNLKDLKDKYAYGNTYSFHAIIMLWNVILGFGYNWFMIFENGHKWWIILIGVVIALVYGFIFLLVWACQKELSDIGKAIDKNLKEFEETNNVTL